MKRWNGWGEEGNYYLVPQNAKLFLEKKVGKSFKPKNITIEQLVKVVPKSLVKDNQLLITDKIERIKHSVGQSLSDWIAIKGGEGLRFPDAVFYPLNDHDVTKIINYAKETDAILIPYGGGTSVVGHLTVPKTTRPVITVDMKRMKKLTKFDGEDALATFQAGISGPELEACLRAKGFTLGHYPQSFEFSTLGGWIASRSSGHFSLQYGRIEQLFGGGRIETPIGSVELPPFPASAAGPDLRELFLGSEGRYGIITNGTVRISPLPEAESFQSAFFRNEEDAFKAVRQISQAKLPLAMMRLSLAKETETTLNQLNSSFLLQGLLKYLALRGANHDKTMLIYGAIGTKKKVSFVLKQAREIIKNNQGIYVGTPIGNHWYKERFRVPYMRNTLWELGYAVDTLETAVEWSKVPAGIKEIEFKISEALYPINEKVHVFTHLSHIYPSGSSIYFTYLFRLADTPYETLERWKIIKKTASQAIVHLGGTISHQHGVGKDHSPYLEAEKGAIGIHILRTISQTLDPGSLLNSDKLIP